MKNQGIKENRIRECDGEQYANHLFTCSMIPIKSRKKDFIMTINISNKAKRTDANLEGKGIWRTTRQEEDGFDAIKEKTK